jgi:hypothetical protein
MPRFSDNSFGLASGLSTALSERELLRPMAIILFLITDGSRLSLSFTLSKIEMARFLIFSVIWNRNMAYPVLIIANVIDTMAEIKLIGFSSL